MQTEIGSGAREWRKVARAAGKRLAQADYIEARRAQLEASGHDTPERRAEACEVFAAVRRHALRVAAELRVEAIGLRVAERWRGTELDREAAQGWAWLRSLEAVRS